MWNDTDIPLAYLISFRTYGTWLHGDKRGSIDRFHNRYRSPYIPPNEKWHRYNQEQLKTEPLILGTDSGNRLKPQFARLAEFGSGRCWHSTSAQIMSIPL